MSKKKTDSNITTIIFLRHADHANNIVPVSEQIRARKTGRVLGGLIADAGVAMPKHFISSPSPRFLTTMLQVMQGMQIMPSAIMPEPGLGDGKMGEHQFTDDDIAYLKQRSVTRGLGLEQILLTDRRFECLLNRRGDEGKKVIRQTMKKRPGETILIASHGAGRLEVVIEAFRGTLMRYQKTPLRIPRLGIVIVTFAGKKVTDVNELGVLIEA